MSENRIEIIFLRNLPHISDNIAVVDALIPKILRFPNIILNISGGGIGKNVLWVMLMTVKKLEECHDVLQAGRARRAEAGRAGLFTERACSTLERVRELCNVYV